MVVAKSEISRTTPAIQSPSVKHCVMVKMGKARSGDMPTILRKVHSLIQFTVPGNLHHFNPFQTATVLASGVRWEVFIKEVCSYSWVMVLFVSYLKILTTTPE